MTERNVLLEGIVGSTAYGLATPESDKDFLGVYLEPLRAIIGLSGASKMEASHVTHDPDRTLHEIGKFCRLALSANPTVSELLWLPEYVKLTPMGCDLIDNRHLFLSQRVRNTYGGYALQQLKRLKDRGDFSSDLKKRTKKHGRHCYRLIIQGMHALREGEIRVRLDSDERDACFEAGELAASDVDAYERMVLELMDMFDDIDSELPNEPDAKAVNDLLIQIRLDSLDTAE